MISSRDAHAQILQQIKKREKERLTVDEEIARGYYDCGPPVGMDELIRRRQRRSRK